MADIAATVAASLAPYRNRPRWWLGLSGGLDSSVLLHLVVALRRQPGHWPPLTVLHVHHGLSPSADAWATACRRLCAAFGVELVEQRVAVEARGSGVEAAARDARYRVFGQRLGQGELLLLAHHRDDQAETLLLRLLRGAGIEGAGAIPPHRVLGSGELLRPLLAFGRAQLAAYAAATGLDWADDDSNADTRFDRNFLRLQVMPLLAQRWPAAASTLARFAAQAAEAGELLSPLAADDLERCGVSGGGLKVGAIRPLAPARRRHLLRHWLTTLALPLPSRAQLAQLERVLDAAVDAQPLVQWPGAEVRRYRDLLFAMPPLPPPPVADIALVWHPGGTSLAGTGQLEAQPGNGGLRADRHYQLRPRRGGERCRPLGRARSQSLKKLLQAAGLPPWWRDRLPLLWCDGELAAVADLWICEGFAAAPDATGWQLRWHYPGAPETLCLMPSQSESRL